MAERAVAVDVPLALLNELEEHGSACSVEVGDAVLIRTGDGTKWRAQIAPQVHASTAFRVGTAGGSAERLQEVAYSASTLAKEAPTTAVVDVRARIISLLTVRRRTLDELISTEFSTCSRSDVVSALREVADNEGFGGYGLKPAMYSQYVDVESWPPAERRKIADLALSIIPESRRFAPLRDRFSAYSTASTALDDGGLPGLMEGFKTGEKGRTDEARAKDAASDDERDATNEALTKGGEEFPSAPKAVAASVPQSLDDLAFNRIGWSQTLRQSFATSDLEGPLAHHDVQRVASLSQYHAVLQAMKENKATFDRVHTRLQDYEEVSEAARTWLGTAAGQSDGAAAVRTAMLSWFHENKIDVKLLVRRHASLTESLSHQRLLLKEFLALRHIGVIKDQ